MGGVITAIFKSKNTKFIGFILDHFIPLFIRDSRFFYKTIIWFWNKKMDPDFKIKAPKMTETEFIEAYERLVPMRSTDNTKKTIDFVLGRINGETILEVGAGNGDLSIECAKKGYDVTATDIAQGNLNEISKKLSDIKIKVEQQNIESLTFADNTFDTVICLHTLEHVKKVYAAISELKRVAKKQIIVIVPRQRYHRYTPDYHLNFFYGPEQLLLAFDIEDAVCEVIDNCLCYAGTVSISPTS